MTTQTLHQIDDLERTIADLETQIANLRAVESRQGDEHPAAYATRHELWTRAWGETWDKLKDARQELARLTPLKRDEAIRAGLTALRRRAAELHDFARTYDAVPMHREAFALEGFADEVEEHLNETLMRGSDGAVIGEKTMSDGDFLAPLLEGSEARTYNTTIADDEGNDLDVFEVHAHNLRLALEATTQHLRTRDAGHGSRATSALIELASS